MIMPLEITPAVIAWAQANGKGDELNTRIADGIAKLKRMMMEPTLAYRRIAQCEDEHKKAMRRLKDELESFQAKCPHPITKYHGDPAGGSDSFTECLVCGYQDVNDRGGYDG